jgi:hypothetical protein
MGLRAVGIGKDWRQAYAVVCTRRDGTEDVADGRFFRTKAEAEAKRKKVLGLWIRPPYKCRVVKARRAESWRSEVESEGELDAQ